VEGGRKELERRKVGRGRSGEERSPCYIKTCSIYALHVMWPNNNKIVIKYSPVLNFIYSPAVRMNIHLQSK